MLIVCRPQTHAFPHWLFGAEVHMKKVLSIVCEQIEALNAALVLSHAFAGIIFMSAIIVGYDNSIPQS